jgi:hypothetical protein
MKLKDAATTLRSACARGTGEAGVSLGALADAAGGNGIGLLLFLPGLGILLPIGFIPGMSQCCALLVLFSALHEVAGARTLWMPDRLRRVRLDAARLSSALEGMGLWLKRIDDRVKPRLSFLIEGRARVLAGGAIALLAVATAIAAFFPLIDMAVAVPMLFLAAGMAMGDGLLAAVGWTGAAVFVGTGLLFI